MTHLFGVSLFVFFVECVLYWPAETQSLFCNSKYEYQNICLRNHFIAFGVLGRDHICCEDRVHL